MYYICSTKDTAYINATKPRFVLSPFWKSSTMSMSSLINNRVVTITPHPPFLLHMPLFDPHRPQYYHFYCPRHYMHCFCPICTPYSSSLYNNLVFRTVWKNYCKIIKGTNSPSVTMKCNKQNKFKTWRHATSGYHHSYNRANRGSGVCIYFMKSILVKISLVLWEGGEKKERNALYFYVVIISIH